jgi:hypothetical protein
MERSDIEIGKYFYIYNMGYLTVFKVLSIEEEKTKIKLYPLDNGIREWGEIMSKSVFSYMEENSHTSRVTFECYRMIFDHIF